MRTLRGRLILSHVLPVLLIVPLVGLVLSYLVETQVLLAGLSDDLVQKAADMAEQASQEPLVWTDAGVAARFVGGYSVRSESWMLLDPYGNLLASNQAQNADQVGQPYEVPDLDAALAGQRQVEVTTVHGLYLVQVLVPVVDSNQEVVGVVHLSEQLSGVGEQVAHLRLLIAVVLGVELLLSVILGLALALNLGRSLQRVTQAIYGVANGREWDALPEEGPEEMRTLLVAFNALVERLRVMEESRRRLLANLVHELGRPLGALQSALQALLGGAAQDAELRQEMLEGMDAQVQRMRPLLDSLTDLHGQVLGTLELNLQRVDLDTWLRRAVSPWRQAAHDKGLHWEVEIAGSMPPLEIDPDRMAQVLGNLLSNAIKYTQEGTVSVRASVQDGGVAIVVADTGIGIAPVEQQRIFEPFYRSQRDKRFPQGMGLGLSIARDLVLAHGGRLYVESQPAQGSRFVAWLPLSPKQAG
jgi:two-component system sensor histidine kinase BaeS